MLFQGKGGLALAGAFEDTYTQAEIKQLLKYDPEQSKRLLAEAGQLTQGLDADSSAQILYQIAETYHRGGQWALAAEAPPESEAAEEAGGAHVAQLLRDLAGLS